MLKHLYFKWLFETHNLLIFVFLALINKVIIKRIFEIYGSRKEPFEILESNIMLCNSGLIVMMLSLFFLVIISKYPCADNNLYYQMIRVGRKRWFIDHVLLVFLIIATYMGTALSYCCIATSRIAFVANGWSLNVSEYASVNGLLALIPLELFNQMPPYKAWCMSVLLLTGYLFWLSGAKMLAFVYGKNLIGNIVLIIMSVMGMCMMYLNSKIMWFFPSAHSILWIHYEKYFKESVFSVGISAIGLFFSGAILFALSYRKMLIVDIDTIREI